MNQPMFIYHDVPGIDNKFPQIYRIAIVELNDVHALMMLANLTVKPSEAFNDLH